MRRTRSRAAPECSRRRRRSVCVCFNRCAAEKAAARGPPSAGPKTPSKAGASSERERERNKCCVAGAAEDGLLLQCKWWPQ